MNLTVIHYGSALPAPRTCALIITQRGFSDSPFRQECLAHARRRNRRAPQPRAREPDPPVPAHVLYSQYRLGLVAPRFDARPRKRHDRAALPVRVRAGDEQLLGRAAARGGNHVQDAHDARARDEEERREAQTQRQVAQAETGALPGWT